MKSIKINVNNCKKLKIGENISSIFEKEIRLEIHDGSGRPLALTG